VTTEIIFFSVLGLIFSFCFTYKTVPLFVFIANNFGIIDLPDNLVKNHKEPTPYLGGLALYFGFIFFVAFFFLIENYNFNSQLNALFLGSTMLLLIGLWDDIVPMKASKKFFMQIVVVFYFLRSGVISDLVFLGQLGNLFFSFWWLSTIINAFNLIDVMDGLATSVALCIVSSLLALSVYSQQWNLVFVLSVFAGSLLGFFCFNKPQASIYLGDSGALFLGGMLGGLSLLFNWQLFNRYGDLAAIAIFAVPLVEIATLIIVRTYKKKYFYEPSPDHFCLYLRGHGWSVGSILQYIIVLSSGQLALAILFLKKEITILSFFILLAIAAIAWLSILFYGVFPHIIIKNYYKRQNFRAMLRTFF